jgi:hypothetical protein
MIQTLGVAAACAEAPRSGRAVRSYCAGLIHWPVSATIPNADYLNHDS